jgi:hypothetical protein
MINLFLPTPGVVGISGSSITRGGEISVQKTTLSISLWSLSLSLSFSNASPLSNSILISTVIFTTLVTVYYSSTFVTAYIFLIIALYLSAFYTTTSVPIINYFKTLS